MSIGQDYFIFKNGPREGEKIFISTIPMVFGRQESAAATINEESVSRQHARVSRVEAGYLVEDLGSSNGTFVNDGPIQGSRVLANGDHIGLGPEVVLQLVLAEREEARPSFTSTNASPGGTGIPQAPSGEQDSGKTVALDSLSPLPTVPPQLVVTVSGQEPVVYPLTSPNFRIGRQTDNDVVINNRYVSRYHAELQQRGQDYYLVPSTTISNPLLLGGEPVMEPTRLEHGAKVRIGGFTPGEMITLVYLSSVSEAETAAQQVIQFTENRVMTIGRDPENEIVLATPSVSRYHAQVEAIGQRYRVLDLRSSNGTFVNGQSIDGEVWVTPGDAIQIGPYRFVVGDHEFAQFDQSEGMSVDVFGINKWVRKDLNIIQDISLSFQPREFIVVVGQSGGGKSSLVDAIAGYRPATHGQVIVNNSIDVYKEFDAIRSTIGYVPQKDIIHMELTVFQALDYAAQLRMPADTRLEERHRRVDEVMVDLDLAHRKDTQISELSGGQQKRVSIGVELLTKPGLFFLDEPTSGLDPGMETELMQLMRRLADQGRTIILITHATKNVMLADKVVFLARGGYLTWFGPPEEALAYFDKYRTERDRRTRPMEFDEIYNLLDRKELGSGPEWAERYRAHEAYQSYIGKPLQEKTPTQKPPKVRVAAKPATQRRQVSALRQFLILSARNIKIILRDRFSLALMLLSAPILASLDFILAFGVGRNPLSFTDGNFNDIIVTLIVLTNTSILVGGLALMRELVKERDIYKRERMVNLRLSSYIMSKMWFALLLAVYQAFFFTLIRFLAFEMPGGFSTLAFFYITVFLMVVAGMMMGLFSSALAPSANSAPLLLILFVIPQIVLSGALVPLPDIQKAPASSSWAFKAAIAISGAGSDVAKDTCWQLTKEQQDELSIDEKNERCMCMGENALREEFCAFPGIGQYYDVAIDQADPIEPLEPGAEPESPEFPPEPEPPADLSNPQSVQTYLSELETYNEKVSDLRDDYEDELEIWKNEQEDYRDKLVIYQEDLTELEVERAIAIGSAESSIRRFKDDYGWAFINQDDRRSYVKTLASTWIAQSTIILVLFIGTVYIQKRRDVS